MRTRLNEYTYQIKGVKPSANSYLLIGSKNVLIDPGSSNNEQNLKTEIKEKISIIINTHEHHDHISANRFFPEAETLAHEKAAECISEANNNCINGKEDDYRPIDRCVKDGDIIDIGTAKLRIMYTPGHTHGSMCIYDENSQFLFTGDSVFAKGTLPLIFDTKENLSSSLIRIGKLKIRKILPSHGWISEDPSDIKRTLDNLEK